MPLIPRNESNRPPIRFGLARRRVVNIHGNNNSNAFAAAQRRARLEETRESFNRNRNARELAAVQARVAGLRAENNARLATSVQRLANNLSANNRSQSQARVALRRIAHNPTALRRLSVAVMLSLLVFAGYAAQAMRAMMSTRNNASAKNALFRVVQSKRNLR
jgi:hypothetical protein